MQEVKEKNNHKKTEKEHCFHCGELCENSTIKIGDNYFCCLGCKIVYELLKSNDLCNYYSFNNAPGISPKEAGNSTKYKYLEDEDVRRKLINFTDANTSTVTLYIPNMHCSSCVWLLESLFKLNPLILSSKVNFLRKEVSVTYEETGSSLRNVVELLSSIGYEPQINLDSLQKKINKDSDKELYIKIGVAGFCFANIMMLSFPEYLAGNEQVEPFLNQFFNYLTILLSLPVFFYSSIDYFRSALTGLKQKFINMDVPISIGIMALFIRSIFEIITGSGAGYMDSFTGLVFLLLVGKIFEKKTYDSLSFDRDYRSYFPISVTKKLPGDEVSIPLEKLKVGERIIVRNQELVPADSILINGTTHIDYSFVTGESNPVEKKSGDTIYAGGKVIGNIIDLDVIKDVNQSYLTQLWNDDAFKKKRDSKITTLANKVSQYFTMSVISIAATAAIYWMIVNPALVLNAFTAVLIVACPCALALSTPFTLGNTLRIFGKNKFYLKNTSVIEAMAKTNTIVFDKTGTITISKESAIEFVANDNMQNELTKIESGFVYSLVRQSNHPLSQQILKHLGNRDKFNVENFNEYPGDGIEGIINGKKVKLGSFSFTNPGLKEKPDVKNTRVYFLINNKIRGFFNFTNTYRPHLNKIVDKFLHKFDVKLITGDSESEKLTLVKIFKSEDNLFFRKLPIDKLNFIKKFQDIGKKVLMIGDGLNDAGALKQSDVGISISEDVNTFSPASDAILDAEQFHRLKDFMDFSKQSMKIIIASFIISFFYNIIGLSFAISGMLSPLIAAILMPVSSISVILFTTGATTFFARKKELLSARDLI